MKKLVKQAFMSMMILGLCVQALPINAAQFSNFVSDKQTGEDINDMVKYEINENEFFYYPSSYAKLTNLSSYTVSALAGITYYQKTVTVDSEEQYFYDSIDYEEYKDGFWYSGTLNLQDIKKTDKGWRAYYTGLLFIR